MKLKNLFVIAMLFILVAMPMVADDWEKLPAPEIEVPVWMPTFGDTAQAGQILVNNIPEGLDYTALRMRFWTGTNMPVKTVDGVELDPTWKSNSIWGGLMDTCEWFLSEAEGTLPSFSVHLGHCYADQQSDNFSFIINGLLYPQKIKFKFRWADTREGSPFKYGENTKKFTRNGLLFT